MGNRLTSETPCGVCGTPFHPAYRRKGQRQQYCSRRCAYKAREVQRVCQTCGKPFTTNLVSTRTDYCSLACIQRSPCLLCGKVITGRAKFQGGERRFCSRACANFVNRTLASKKGTNYAVLGFAATIRRTGRLACERCGFDGEAALVVHHRDRDRGNAAEENLETLCANCHAIEHRADSLTRTRALQLAHLVARQS